MIFETMIKVIAIAIISIIFILVLKPQNNHFSIVLTLIVSIILFLIITPFLKEVIDFFNIFSKYIDFKTLYLDVVLKIISISYICEMAVDICKDAGINAIASKIEFGGKILIMVLSLPIISEVLKTVVTIL